MRMFRSIAVLLSIFALSTAGFAWAPATHAYIANQLYEGIDPINTMFGAVAPDLNQVLSTDQNSPFFTATHYGFQQVWDARNSVPSATAKHLAFGFVTHNELWGADHFAHITSNLYPNYVNYAYPGQNGYVWVKAAQLCSLMTTQLQQGGSVPPMAAFLLSDPMNCHFIVEYAMDIVLKSTRDPQIAQKLLNASRSYSTTSLSAILANGFPGPLGGAMATYHPNWAGLVQMYATALNQPTLDKNVPAVGVFLEFLAEQLLGGQIRQALGLQPTDPLPDWVKPQLCALINLGLQDSIALCAVDYPVELDMTIHAVRQNLAANGIQPTF